MKVTDEQLLVKLACALGSLIRRRIDRDVQALFELRRQDKEDQADHDGQNRHERDQNLFLNRQALFVHTLLLAEGFPSHTVEPDRSKKARAALPLPSIRVHSR